MDPTLYGFLCFMDPSLYGFFFFFPTLLLWDSFFFFLWIPISMDSFSSFLLSFCGIPLFYGTQSLRIPHLDSIFLIGHVAEIVGTIGPIIYKSTLGSVHMQKIKLIGCCQLFDLR